jgi:hypothetical protein
MDAISQISGAMGYTPSVAAGANVMSGAATGAQLPGAVQRAPASETGPMGVQATSVSSSSHTMSAQMESLIASTSAMSNGDVVNILLLLVAMKLLSGGDAKDEDKKMMAALLMLAASSQQQQSGTVAYQSMSMSMSQSDLNYNSVSISPLQNSLGQAAYTAPTGAATGVGQAGLDVSG